MGGGALGFYTPPFLEVGVGIETKPPEFLFDSRSLTPTLEMDSEEL